MIITRRDVGGYVAAALIARYARYHLLEDMTLGPDELIFSSERRLAALLGELVPLGEGTLTRVFIAGLGPPADQAAALAALERLDFLGVETEWIDPRPWTDGAFRERAAVHARLVLSPRRVTAPARFVHDALGLADHRSGFIVRASSASGESRWHVLLRALTHDLHHPVLREQLRRLAFGSIRMGESDERLIAEELERLRWLRHDLRLLVPFPVAYTHTRQAMALVDVRKQTGAPLLHPDDVARRVSRSQPVRYTFTALSRAGAWNAHLRSWPAGIGDLAGVPALAGAGEGGFRVSIDAPHHAVFEALDPALSFFELAHDVAARL